MTLKGHDTLCAYLEIPKVAGGAQAHVTGLGFWRLLEDPGAAKALFDRATVENGM